MCNIKDNSILADKEIILFIGQTDDSGQIVKKLNAQMNLKHYICDGDSEISELESLNRIQDFAAIDKMGGCIVRLFLLQATGIRK